MYTAGEVGSLLESINDGIKIIAEDQSSMKKDLRDMKSTIDNMTSDIVDIKLGLKVMNTKLDGKVEKKIADGLENRIVKLEKATAV